MAGSQFSTAIGSVMWLLPLFLLNPIIINPLWGFPFFHPKWLFSSFWRIVGHFEKFEKKSEKSQKFWQRAISRKMPEKMSDLCEVETDGFVIFMEVLYGLVVTIGILANALVCCVFLSDIRIKNVSIKSGKITILSCIYRNFSGISDIWLLIYQLQTRFIYFPHCIYLSK